MTKGGSGANGGGNACSGGYGGSGGQGGAGGGGRGGPSVGMAFLGFPPDLSEVGIVDEPAKYLLPMKVNDQASYGQVFGVAKDGPYRFRVWVRLPQRTDEIEFGVQAWSPHRNQP